MAKSEARLLHHEVIRGRFSTLYARGILGMLAATTALAVITAIGCHAYLIPNSSISIIPSLTFGAVMWLWWGAIALGMWSFAKRSPQVLTFSLPTVVLQLSVGSILSVLHMTLLQFTLQAGSHWSAWKDAYSHLNYITLSRFGADLMIYGFIFGISGFWHMQSQREHDAMQKLELERQLTQAQLQALQSQMEPHFLFNTMNAITSLVAQKRNDEAMQMLNHLNTILRTTLQRKAPEKVPFAEELKIIESYLAIQQVRFADRLQVKINATPEALDGLIPCFLLQPIVENAVQHGIAPKAAGGSIETCVKRIGDKLWMQVRDDGCGAGISSAKGHGIGTQNVKERLAYFYPGSYEFHAVPPADGGYEVTIQIPYERAAT